jgi:hypothetical protein
MELRYSWTARRSLSAMWRYTGHGMTCSRDRWVQVVRILAGAYDVQELPERQLCRPSLGVGGDVAGCERPKLPAPGEVILLVDRTRLAKVGVVARCMGGTAGTGGAGVTVVACPLRVDNVASQAHEIPVLSPQVKGHGRNGEALHNPALGLRGRRAGKPYRAQGRKPWMVWVDDDVEREKASEEWMRRWRSEHPMMP